MTTASIVLNLVSLSSALGALLVVAALWLLLRRRGLLYLFLFILTLGLDYLLGILLFAAAPPQAPAGGLLGTAAGVLPPLPRLLLAGKHLCQAGLLVSGPLAVHALHDRPVGPVLRNALAFAAALVVLSGAVGLFAGAGVPRWASALLLAPMFLGYATYLYCLGFLLARLPHLPRGFARGATLAAAAALACLVPALVGEDLYLLLSDAPPRVLTDPIAFLALTGGTLLLSVLWLVRSLRPGREREQLEAFCSRHALSPREQEVLALLLEGRSYKEIASRLAVSPDTVKTHVSHLYRKTGTAGRVELRYRLRAPSR